MNNPTIKIDVVSDVACPWCYVGKRRLESAIAQWKGVPIEVTWHPFQLDPNMPTEGQDRDTYLTKKFGTAEMSEVMNRLTDAGKEEGITFNFGNKWLAVNTLPLHQLLHVAGQEGFKSALKERFLKAYFDENLHLNDTEVLISVMKEFDWDATKTQKIIKDESLAKTVQEEIAHYQERGVTGVPFFIINNKYGMNGAQPAKIFLNAFAQVSQEELAVTPINSCDTQKGDC